ncbi:rhodanese-like domain-containing protein [Phyllobacterium zundukense]|uniref:Guanylyl cyclase n=1 Tax=Phyllobacterium zundukense TaxID=1867719 RepID=A0A2N9VUC1_9HYPH|nr:rhodanese-like domain-containing protein [Phyllobacterium zundukense]ATU92969.1 guanylyl cyclase [Phyllobacterium zundukense]PIO43089.1 guanylyl cyclase [Phyllobacterium zundukense]
MGVDHAERRLVAILAADIVGYSRLIEADEAGTLTAMKALRCEAIDPLVAEYHGRIVKQMGDGLIMAFGSVVDAVACAVALQKEVATRQAEVSPERRLLFRMGINLGDVVVEGDDLLGDGVNVAARLEQICESGGLFISGTAYDQLQGKLELPLEFIGEQHVKNITRPVRTYRVRFEGSERSRRFKIRHFRKWGIPATIALLLLAAAPVLWLSPWKTSVETASMARMALPLPDKPSIAVLPFDNISSDPEQAYFADGMTEDLITDLSKLSGIFVIARNSTFAYKGKPTKVQQVAEDLGVRYVLEGSVRRQGDQVRINAQLIDALGGHHLWADRYDGAMSDIFSLQDKVIGEIVSALTVEFTTAEKAESEQVETKSPQAYDALLQGWDHLRRDTEDETLKAIPLFETAVALDPNYSRAYAALASANWRIAVSNWEAASLGFQKAMERVDQNLALAMRKPNPLAYAISAEVLARQGHYDEAFAGVSRAMELAPNDPENHISKARVLNATGRAPEAEREVRQAMRLDPQYPPSYLRVLAMSLFHQEKYENAVESLELLVTRQSDVAEDYATLVSSFGHLGRTDGVKANIAKYDALTVPAGYSPLTVQELGWYWYGDIFYYERTYRDRLQEGLRKAGVQEGAGTDISYDDYARLISKSNGEYNVRGTTKIDAPTAKRLHDRGVKLVDVRTTLSFNRGHVPGAINLSVVENLSNDTLSNAANKDEEVIFSCHGKYCGDSAYASAKALVWGFKNVYHFAGGFPAWEDAHYPVEASMPQ